MVSQRLRPASRSDLARRRAGIAIGWLAAATVWCGSPDAVLGQTGLDGQAPPRVTRARRPQFRLQDWEGIYFNNLFREGLVGPPPSPSADGAANQLAGGPTQATPALGNDVDGSASQNIWTRLITAEAIEDEIKRTVLRLAQQVTTPSKFQSDYLHARQSYSMLSVWFSVILEYSESVRWRQQAATIQPAMARAAANARVSSEQSYQYARARLDELQQLMRGESPPAVEPPVESIEWPSAVGRSPVMVRLQESLDVLKPLLSSEGALRRDADEVSHHGQVVAALGQVLLQPDMDDADDEDYAKLARGMMQEALALLEATRLGNQADAAQAMNRLERRCNQCHADWR